MPCKSPIVQLQEAAIPCALTKDSKRDSVAKDETKKFVFISLIWGRKKKGGGFFFAGAGFIWEGKDSPGDF